MTAERDLAALLRSLSPRLNDGRYVYTQVRTEVPAGADPVVVVREDEGVTLVLDQVQADELDLAYEFVVAWITLEVHSALDAVDLTAAVSHVLTGAGISANVVAGYTHDQGRDHGTYRTNLQPKRLVAYVEAPRRPGR